MTIEELLKKEIDSMSYRALLERWRFSPAGDPIFQGEIGQYYKDVMSNKKQELTYIEQVRTSKDIG